MESEKVSLLSKVKFSSFEKLNENFLKAKCYVMALGKNVNKSNFEKDNVDKAYPTLAYAPVIGHLMTDENGVSHLGGHDYKVDLDKMELKSQCVPFGVVLPSEEPVYEDVVEDDGTTATYLTCQVVLWISRYPELTEAFYNNDIFTSQSMEILYSKSEPLKDDPNYTNIIDFSFDALCMLQKSDDEKFNIEPCFPSASIVPITYSINKDEFSSMMKDLKDQLSTCFNKKGGNNLDKKLEILSKYSKSVEDLDFSIDDMSEEELSTKMEELFGEKKEEPIAFSATYNQKREALNNALDPVIVKDDDGNYVEETYFYVEDFSDDYVFVEKDHWDKNDYECKHGRFTYTFDEASLTATITSDFEEMVLTWLTLDEQAKINEDRSNYESMTKEFSEYKNNHTYENSEFEKLKKYHEDKEAEERKLAEESLFAKYDSMLNDSSEYSELKKNANNYELKDLEKECLYIVGKFSMENKHEDKVVKDESIKFSIDKGEENKDKTPYNGVMEKYLNK